MKRPARIHDPLEETLENPDLPPVAVATGTHVRPAAPRRSLRRVLVLSAFLLAGAVVALRLVVA